MILTPILGSILGVFLTGPKRDPIVCFKGHPFISPGHNWGHIGDNWDFGDFGAPKSRVDLG